MGSNIIEQIIELNARGAVHQAEAALESALLANPDTPDLHNLKAELRFKQGDVAVAKRILQDLLGRWPNHAQALNNLGVICWQAGDTPQATYYFSRSFEVEPTNEDLVYNFGDALEASKRWDDARHLYDTYLRAFPQDETIKQRRAQLSRGGDGTTTPVQPTTRATMGSAFEYGGNFYGPTLLNPTTLARLATSPETWAELLDFHHLLASDEYVDYVDHMYREGVHRYGAHWWYLDIVNVLFAAAKTIEPRNYLEIGVRRGRSVCTVARAYPPVNITAFDMWIPGYAGMDNPGPEFVQEELKKHHHSGTIEFVDGDSHQTIPEYFRQHPDRLFDLMTVDGDHTEAGAFDDLCNVIPHLAPGGVLVFDDISHPAHPYLLDVWRRVSARFPNLRTYEYTDFGYGVAFAINRG